MTQQLHDALARIGDDAPHVAPTPDLAPTLWRRGRRARTRDRVVAAGAVLGLVVALGGITAAIGGGPTRILPASPPDDVPGVPDRLVDVPEWLVQLTESDTNEMTWAPELDTASDLAVGQAAAAFTAGDYGRLPVVVHAEDGRYLPLELPGFADAAVINTVDGHESALSLSPDGTRLAYAWWDPRAPLDAPMPAGVRVVDLTAGEITEIPLEGGNGIDVDLLAWSPSGEWLAWFGQETRTWTPMSKGGRGDFVAGRIRLGATTSEPVDVGRAEDTTIAISDDGRVAFWNGARVTTGDHRIRVASAGAGWWAPGRFAPGSHVMVLSDGSVGALLTVDVFTGREEESPAPADLSVGTEVRPLGWTPDGQVVVTHGAADDKEAILSLVDPARDRWRDVGTVAPELLGSLTLATDLVAADRPTVERPSPDWPWSIERRAAVGIASGVGVLGVGLLLWTRRRRW